MSFVFLSHVPFWVWWLLVAVLALGLSATRTRQKPWRAALAMPLVMTGVSAYGAASTFTTPSHFPALIAWTSAVAIVVVLRAALGWWGNVSWVPETRRVRVPGSWLPLVWMLAIFALKFAVAVSLAMHPAWKSNGGFAAWVCLAYGAFSGIFLGRALAIRRAMRNASVAGQASLAS